MNNYFLLVLSHNVTILKASRMISPNTKATILSVLFFTIGVTNIFADDLYSTMHGLTGAIMTPSPFSRRLEEGTGVYSVNFFEQRDPSTLIQERGAHHWLSFNAGVMRNVEFASGQEFFTGSANRRRRYFWNLKYSFPNDSLPAAISAIIPGSSHDYTSIIATFGWKAFYAGLGTNVSGTELTEPRVLGELPFGVAQFGGYRMVRRKATSGMQQNVLEVVGRPDEIYPVIGGQVNLGNNIQWLYDYNGDIFSSGFRLSFDTSTFQIVWNSSGDYDKLFLRNQDNITASAQYRF